MNHKFIKNRGFTLIELLVVIAIIAILVIIVIVAINPIQRLADAADRRAAANVRSTGTLVQACITQEASLLIATTLYSNTAAAAPLPGGCANAAQLATFGNTAASYEANTAHSDICVSQQGAATAPAHWYNYRASTPGTPTCTLPAVCVAVRAGTVTEEQGIMPTTTITRCP